jgi:hypothetical protein
MYCDSFQGIMSDVAELVAVFTKSFRYVCSFVKRTRTDRKKAMIMSP